MLYLLLYGGINCLLQDHSREYPLPHHLLCEKEKEWDLSL